MYGLVFAGGGAKGSYQVGVWKAIRELNYEIGIVCGTSVGALNGAFLAQEDYDTAYEMWTTLSMSSVFDADKELLKDIDTFAQKGFREANIKTLKKIYDHIVEHNGLNISPLRNKVEELLDEDRLRNSPIDFGLVTISLNDRKSLKLYAEDIPYGELKYYLLGSALVPGFTQDEKSPLKFMDGGISDNFPIKMVIDKGYKKIIAVRLHDRRLPKYDNVDITYIKPSESLGNFLYFEKEKSIKNMKMGYLDAMKEFGKLYGDTYYFEKLPTEGKVIRRIINNNKTDQKKLGIFFYLPGLETRELLEKAIPKLAKRLAVSGGNYQDIYVAMIEHLMTHEKMDRLKEYDIEEAREILLDIEYPLGSLESICQILIK